MDFKLHAKQISINESVVNIKYTARVISLYELYLILISANKHYSLDISMINDSEIEIYSGSEYLGSIRNKGRMFEMDLPLLKNADIAAIIKEIQNGR